MSLAQGLDETNQRNRRRWKEISVHEVEKPSIPQDLLQSAVHFFKESFMLTSVE